MRQKRPIALRTCGKKNAAKEKKRNKNAAKEAY